MSLQSIKKKCIVLATAVLLSMPSSIFAATVPSLSFDVTQKTVEVNETFTVKVLIDTIDKEIAGADAKIKFTPGLLRVQSIKTGSIFNDYPSNNYDNESGSISISGIASSKNDQFKGKGELAEIRFKAEHQGTDNLRFLFGKGQTTESNLAVTFGNGDILEEVSVAKIEVEEKGQGSGNSRGAATTDSDNNSMNRTDNNPNVANNAQEEVLAATDQALEAEGQEMNLNANAAKKQDELKESIQSAKQPVLGVMDQLSFSPRDWNKTSLIALLFINIAAIGVIGTILIRKHRSSL